MLVYGRNNMSSTDLFRHMEQGEDVHCPKCRSLLRCDGSYDETTGAYKCFAVYCSKDSAHFSIHLDPLPRPGFWEQFKKKEL